MSGRYHDGERLSEIAMAIHQKKIEDLEEFELREVHELDALLAGGRLAPRAHGRIPRTSRRARPEGARG